MPLKTTVLLWKDSPYKSSCPTEDGRRFTIYVAPVKGPTSPDSLTLNNISVGPFTLAAGDLNAHSSLWDEHLPADQRDQTVEVSPHTSIESLEG